MSKKAPKLKKEEIDHINKAMSGSKKGVSITKGRGGKILRTSTELVDHRGVKLVDYSGKTLKHRKSYIDPTTKSQIIVCEAGTKYDDIDIELKKQVEFTDSDFE
jgi:hypothetical protein